MKNLKRSDIANIWMVTFFICFVLFVMAGINPVCASQSFPAGPTPSCQGYSSSTYGLIFHNTNDAENWNSGTYSIINCSDPGSGSGSVDFYWAPYPNQNGGTFACHASWWVQSNGGDSGYTFHFARSGSLSNLGSAGPNLYWNYGSWAPGAPAMTIDSPSSVTSPNLGESMMYIQGGTAIGSSISDITGYGEIHSYIVVNAATTCAPSNFTMFFDNTWPDGLKEYYFVIWDSNGRVVNQNSGATYGISVNWLPSIGVNATYQISGNAHQGSAYSDIITSQFFNVSSNCSGSGGVFPNATPTAPSTQYNSNWTNLTWPNGTWVIGNYTIIPYLPGNFTIGNITNWTQFDNYFNTTFIPISLVHNYYSLIDSFFNLVLSVISSVLNILLQPIYYLATVLQGISQMFINYLTSLLYYIWVVSSMFQNIVYILPLWIISLIDVVLLIDLIWIVLKGRK